MKPDDELLEPILPKTPPTAGDPPPLLEADTDASAVDLRSQNGSGWERWVLLGCAVAATLCLVIITIRLTSIAEDQRVQTCQTRVFAAEQMADFDGPSGRAAQQRFARELAKCVGIDVPAANND